MMCLFVAAQATTAIWATRADGRSESLRQMKKNQDGVDELVVVQKVWVLTSYWQNSNMEDLKGHKIVLRITPHFLKEMLETYYIYERTTWSFT